MFQKVIIGNEKTLHTEKGQAVTHMNSLLNSVFAGILVLILIVLLPVTASAGKAIGPRAGYDFDSDNLVIGVEAELGRAFQNFRFAPSLDFGLGDHSTTVLNADFRLYLFHLPETGLHFYGSAGPTILLNSKSKDGQSEIGFSLVAGLKIPMKGMKRYNLETRFGYGDIPKFKLMLTLLFGI